MVAMNVAHEDGLCSLLRPQRLTAVVDVGANPIDGDPPYQSMLGHGLCTVVGFDPQPSALALLQGRSPLETYLPYAVGDGTTQTLHICSAPGMSSFLKPDVASLALFPLFPELGRVVDTLQLATRPLDAITEVKAIDLLKIDAQGSELAILRSGRQKLAEAVAIQTEVSFVPLYENQPPFGLLDTELRAQGFTPHALVDLKEWIIAPMVVNKDPRRALNQLLEADMVYVRDLRTAKTWPDEQLKQLALIAHHCYRSFDLALFCLLELERRDCVPGGVHGLYLKLLRSGAVAAQGGNPG